MNLFYQFSKGNIFDMNVSPSSCLFNPKIALLIKIFSEKSTKRQKKYVYAYLSLRTDCEQLSTNTKRSQANLPAAPKTWAGAFPLHRNFGEEMTFLSTHILEPLYSGKG
jgi:hypothetical protein